MKKRMSALIFKWMLKKDFVKIKVSKTETLLGDMIEKEYGIKLDRSYYVSGKYYDLRYKKLLIESDGSHWHSSKKATRNDKYKDRLASSNGYTLLRFNLNCQKEVKKKWNEIKVILDPHFKK